MSDSHLSRLHTAAAVTRIEHRQQLVRYFFGMAVQPAAEDMFLMLAASSGATKNAWLYAIRGHEGTERTKCGQCTIWTLYGLWANIGFRTARCASSSLMNVE